MSSSHLSKPIRFTTLPIQQRVVMHPSLRTGGKQQAYNTDPCRPALCGPRRERTRHTIISEGGWAKVHPHRPPSSLTNTFPSTPNPTICPCRCADTEWVATTLPQKRSPTPSPFLKPTNLHPRHPSRHVPLPFHSSPLYIPPPSTLTFVPLCPLEPPTLLLHVGSIYRAQSFRLQFNAPGIWYDERLRMEK